MSLLQALLSKKDQLKITETIITRPDGTKYKETKDKIEQMPGNQYGFVVDTKPDNIPAKVIENLYLGSQDCTDDNVLKKNNIQLVLSIGIEAPVKYSDITYKFVPCLDLPETCLEESLRECVPFLEGAEKQRKNILVHCNAGVSRSASVIVGYLILVKGFNYQDACKIVKAARSCIKPNSGFEKQLQCLSSR